MSNLISQQGILSNTFRRPDDTGIEDITDTDVIRIYNRTSEAFVGKDLFDLNIAITSLKVLGIWNKLKALFVFKRSNNMVAARIDWKRDLFGYVSGGIHHNRKKGLYSDGTMGSYFDTLCSYSQFPDLDIHNNVSYGIGLSGTKVTASIRKTLFGFDRKLPASSTYYRFGLNYSGSNSALRFDTGNNLVLHLTHDLSVLDRTFVSVNMSTSVTELVLNESHKYVTTGNVISEADKADLNIRLFSLSNADAVGQNVDQSSDEVSFWYMSELLTFEETSALQSILRKYLAEEDAYAIAPIYVDEMQSFGPSINLGYSVNDYEINFN